MERDNPKPRKRFSSDSSDVSVNASGNRAGFMASLLGRRSLSLSIDDDHPIDLLGNENGDEIKQEVEGIRNRTRTLSLGGENVDGDTSDETTPDQERRRSRTMSISSLIFGDNNRSQKPSEINNDVFASSTTENSNFQQASEREVSQTDHLNKRLLSSLLTRMNSFATNFIDPNGTGETVGQVYTDDVMMDRILRRVDSSPTSNNSGSSGNE